MLEEFLALSRVVTGVTKLDPQRGAEYLDRLISSPWALSLRQVLGRFQELQSERDLEAAVKQHILGDETLRATMSQIALLWLTSALRDNEQSPLVLRYGSEDAYFSGLAWQMIGAHVPGLSGGYFGHWRYPPENGPPVTG